MSIYSLVSYLQHIIYTHAGYTYVILTVSKTTDKSSRYQARGFASLVRYQ